MTSMWGIGFSYSHFDGLLQLPINNASIQAERDTRLADIVGRYLNADLIANDEANEAFTHLARNVGEKLVPTRNADTEHRSRENSRHGSLHLNLALRIFLRFLGLQRSGPGIGPRTALVGAIGLVVR